MYVVQWCMDWVAKSEGNKQDLYAQGNFFTLGIWHHAAFPHKRAAANWQSSH